MIQPFAFRMRLARAALAARLHLKETAMLRRSVTLGFAIAAALCAQPDRQFTDVPDVPTPPNVVDAMLDLADIKPADVLIDLGSGDGRIVIAACKRFRSEERRVGKECRSR